MIQSSTTPARNDALHQERVNTEMFRAIEVLGRKLERVESERDRLARRLALIESAATVDEKTGKLYLPVVVDSAQSPQVIPTASAPRWMVATSLMSSALALLALGVVAFRPVQPALTPAQLAALTMLTQPQLAHLDEKSWSRVTPDNLAEDLPVENQARTAKPLPDDAFLAQEENSAVVPGDVSVQEAPLVATVDTVPSVDTAPLEAASVIEPAAGESPTGAVDSAPVPDVPVESVAAADSSVDLPVKLTAAPEPQPQQEVKTVQPVAEEPASVEAAQQQAVSPTYTVSVIPPDKNLPENVAQLEKRAFDGVPEAQHDLATLYASGNAVAQDYKRAAYWFSRAADGGIANADYNLGVMFQQGLGVKKDLKKAVSWYVRAADLGHPEAMYNLGIAHIEGIGTTRDIDSGVAYFKRAANAGVAQAAYNLGVLYESSFIGKIDKKKALDWYQVAASSGHADAESAIHRLEGQLASADSDSVDTEADQQQALSLADMVEPAAGGEYGEGDASPPEDEIDAPSFTSDLVADIQEKLVQLGYLPAAKPSGAMDPKTTDAIRAFQKKSGLDVDGKPSRDLLQRLSAAK